MRSNKTSGGQKAKPPKKCFLETHIVTSQWLSNSFSSTLADILEISSKDLVLHSNTPGNLSRLLLPSLWGPGTLWACLASIASNQSADSLLCWRGASLTRSAHFHVPSETYPGRPCSGLCSQRGSPLALAQAHKPGDQPTPRGSAGPAETLSWVTLKPI